MADGSCCWSTDGSSTSTFMGFGKVYKTAGSFGLYKKIKRVRSKLGLTGKQIKRKLGLSRVNSAAGVNSGSIYGATGSIVGRF